jgi:hypothetical protein
LALWRAAWLIISRMKGVTDSPRQAVKDHVAIVGGIHVREAGLILDAANERN